MKKFFKNILNIIAPPICYVCKKELHQADGVCYNCFKKFYFIKDPLCEICGVPFEFDLQKEKYGNEKNKSLMCPICIKNITKIHYSQARGLLKYNDHSRHLLFPLKHGDQTHLAKYIAGIMTKNFTDIIQKCDYIIPVPLHTKRLLKRKYNQTELLANQISKLTKKPILYSILKRKKFIRSQENLDRNARKKNVAGAFSLSQKHQPKIEGKILLLIDDVITTGATINECAKILKSGYANEIYVISLCKVTRIL